MGFNYGKDSEVEQFKMLHVEFDSEFNSGEQCLIVDHTGLFMDIKIHGYSRPGND